VANRSEYSDGDSDSYLNSRDHDYSAEELNVQFRMSYKTLFLIVAFFNVLDRVIDGLVNLVK